MNKALIQRLTNVDLTKCADLEAGDGGVGRLLRMWRERERAEQATLPLIKMKPRWVICVIVDIKPPQTTSFSPTLPPQMTSLSPISSPLWQLLLRTSHQPSSTDDFEETLCRKSTLLTSGQKHHSHSLIVWSPHSTWLILVIWHLCQSRWNT